MSMKATDDTPSASATLRATVDLPEPLPPAMPTMKGFITAKADGVRRRAPRALPALPAARTLRYFFSMPNPTDATTDTVRVFVNAAAVDVTRGASAIECIRHWRAAEADAVTAGDRLITDSRGLPIDPATR